MINFDPNNPLTAQIISQGQARGYSPMAIAAIASRPYDENGGRTNGKPGDGGLAIGGMQWHPDRQVGLNAIAAKNGTTWDDPSVQAQHIYDELDGPEAAAKDRLMKAQSADDATSGIMSYVRPAGWNKGYDNLNHGNDTLARTSQIAAYLQDPSKGVPDMPQMQQGRSAATDPTASPGAQTYITPGLGVQSSSFETPLGVRLQQAGAALASISNPAQANALESMANSGLAVAQLQQGAKGWKDKGLSSNGQYRIYSNDKGDTRYEKVPDAVSGASELQMQKLDIQKQKNELAQQRLNAPTGAEEKAYAANDQTIEQGNNIQTKVANLQDMLRSGQIQVDPASRVKAGILNFTGNSDVSSEALKDMEATVNQQLGAIMRGEKGPQTKKNMEQAMAQLQPVNGQYDPVTLMSVLDRVSQTSQELTNPATRANIALAKRKSGFLSVDENGDPDTIDKYTERALGKQDVLQDRRQDLQEGISPDGSDSLDAWRKAHQAKNKISSTAPVQSRGNFLLNYGK